MAQSSGNSLVPGLSDYPDDLTPYFVTDSSDGSAALYVMSDRQGHSVRKTLFFRSLSENAVVSIHVVDSFQRPLKNVVLHFADGSVKEYCVNLEINPVQFLRDLSSSHHVPQGKNLSPAPIQSSSGVIRRRLLLSLTLGLVAGGVFAASEFSSEDASSVSSNSPDSAPLRALLSKLFRDMRFHPSQGVPTHDSLQHIIHSLSPLFHQKSSDGFRIVHSSAEDISITLHSLPVFYCTFSPEGGAMTFYLPGDFLETFHYDLFPNASGTMSGRLTKTISSESTRLPYGIDSTY